MQWDDKFCWGIFLLDDGNLTRSDFESSENFYLVRENESLVGGGQKFGGEKSTGGGIFPGGGNEQIFG